MPSLVGSEMCIRDRPADQFMRNAAHVFAHGNGVDPFDHEQPGVPGRAEVLGHMVERAPKCLWHAGSLRPQTEIGGLNDASHWAALAVLPDIVGIDDRACLGIDSQPVEQVRLRCGVAMECLHHLPLRFHCISAPTRRASMCDRRGRTPRPRRPDFGTGCFETYAATTRCGSRKATNRVFDVAPTSRATSVPPLNRIIAGMPRTLFVASNCLFSSALTLAIVRRPAYSSAISSSSGFIALQGPHHSAQKSTRIGTV